MSAGGDVYDPVDYANVNGNAEANARAGMDVQGTPTAGIHRRGLLLGGGGGGMSKGSIRALAYYLIVGGVVVWVVSHLAPVRA